MQGILAFLLLAERSSGQARKTLRIIERQDVLGVKERNYKPYKKSVDSDLSSFIFLKRAVWNQH